MAVIKKTLFAKNLSNYSVLVNDTDPTSRYFKISELSDTFTGGKNAFLIAGSEELVSDTKIQIELRDAAGNIIYHEPGEGAINTNISGSTNASIITEYYEGVSKVVSVYVYPDTAYGPCTLTILGELSQYVDSNGIVAPVPLEWENKYNVKWEKQINVNPVLANTTKIRFYQRPTATITEILSPIFRIESGSKVNSGVSQSFADIKLSRLETFAGDVKRVKVFRTSQGDISDFDLIQDILVESKELLTTTELTGSVISQTGTLTSETLKNFWNTGSLTVALTNSRVESGVKLNGSGYFTYTSSLDLKGANTYELSLDAFYSSSTTSNLGIYLSYVSSSTTFTSSLATLNGITPTKYLLDTVIPFKLDRDYPTASLYFSQSQGEWHLGNISLKLSEDTAFSPDEISFITTMPTVIGNETFNFKFEFYDVNNNFVPVSVTQSANFTGGANINNTLLLVSASTSQSLAALAAVSSSISGTMTVYSQSADTTITNVSSSISGSIISLSGSVSSSINTLSSSIANELILTSGSVLLLSGSFLQFTQSVSSSLNSLSQSVSSSIGTLSSSISSSIALNTSQSAFQVFSASQYLDKFIFTDENGKINQPPTASSPGLYLGSDHLGYFSGSDWKTYMDNQGDFYLTGSTNNFLAWSSQLGTLQVQGVINIQGGNAATTSSLNDATSSLLGSINSATASLSSSLAPNIFTDSTGKINRPPTVLVNSSEGLFLGSTNLGYYSGSDWKTYMDNQGDFYLSGPGTNSLSWVNGALTINGVINITGGNAATDANALLYSQRAVTSGSNAAANAVSSGSVSAAAAQTAAELFATGIGNNAATAATNAAATGSIAAANAAASASLSASAAQTAAINLAKADASASINLLANGGWTAGTGTFITARSISSPVLAGNAGYISEILRVGENGITLDGGNKKIFVGTGTYNSTNTPFFFASGSTNIFSLGDKLSWDGNNLSITGNITVSAGPVAAAISNLNSTTSSLNSSVSQINTATGSLTTAVNNKISSGGAAADVNSNTTTISGGKIRTGLIQSNNHSGTGDGSGFATAGTSIDLTGGGISAKNFRITSGGDAFFKGEITALSGFIGSGSVGFAINNNYFRNGTKTTFNSAGTGIYIGTDGIGLDNTFTVSSAGVLTATAATITGNITATNITATTAGSIAGWSVGPNTLGTSNLKLNSLRPAIEIYSGSSLVVDISSATSLSPINVGGASTSGIPYTTTAVIEQTVSEETTLLSAYQVDLGADPLYSTGGTVGTFTPTSTGAYEATIVLGGIVSRAIGLLEPNPNAAFSFLQASYTIGVSIRQGSTSGTEVANFSYGQDWSQAVATTTFNRFSEPNPTLTGTISVTNGTTYYIVPYISAGQLESLTTNGNLSTHELTATYRTPTITSVSVSRGISKSELIAGGFQIVFNTDRFLRVERANNTDFVSVGGGLTCTGDVTANTSDKRLKENIRIIENPLEKIENIRGVYFNYTDEAKLKTGYTNGDEQVGFIAQEVQRVLPHIVKPAPFDKNQSTGKSISGENYLTIQYEKIVPLLLEGIKELKKQIEELKKINNGVTE